MKGSHPLEQLLQHQQRALETLAATHPAFWELSRSAIQLLAEMAFNKAAGLSPVTEAERVRVLLWQYALKYETLALNLIALPELDPAYALLRSALEACRVATYIGDDNARAERWLRSKLDDGVRLGSKFDQSGSLGQLLKELYEVTSAWGTHGHHMVLVWGETELDARRPGMLSFSKEGIKAALGVWLSTFWMTQRVFVKSFYDTHEAAFDELVREFDRLEKTSLPLLDAFAKE